MSIQSNFPAIKPTMLLDFASVKALDPRITFTRASTGTFYGTQTAKAEENLLLQSQAFNENAWQRTEVTATANSIAAPDGTTTADTLTNTTVNTLHIAFQAATLNGQAYAFSVFAKKGTADFVFLRGSDGTSARNAWFNLATGAVGTVETNITASITDVGNGWYRCVGVWSISSSASANYSVGISEANGVTSYAGTTKDIYLWGAQLEQRSAVTAYTATTTQPITNYVPQLLTAASGVARFDHNPITDESLGLLIEEQRTNLLLRSEDFSNASWSKINSTVAANTAVAPDGTLTADKLVSNSGTSTQSAQQATSTTNSLAYTYSAYVKAAEFTSVRLRVVEATTFGRSVFIDVNLTDGSTTRTSANVATINSSSVNAVGNGWYRISISFTLGGTDANMSCQVYLNDGTNNFNVTGNGYSGIFLWGAQLEVGAFPTSYIQTVASQVTRAADAASMTGANFSSWYNQAEGTFVASPTALKEGSFIYQASNNSATGDNRIFLRYLSNQTQGLVVTSAVTQAQIFDNTGFLASSNTTAFAYNVNDFAIRTNGGASASAAANDSSGTVPVVSRLDIGSFLGSSAFINGTIRKLAYYPLRVTNAQLQALTS
jgi:hypothetical protein